MINLTQNSNIRRIDELGRIVIPKDIRKKMHIKDNEPLEIYIDSDEIKIKKYSSLPDVLEFIKYLVDIGERITNNKYIVTDRDHIISASNSELLDSPLNPYLENLVTDCREEKNITLNTSISGEEITGRANIVPIIVDNDRSGLIIEYNDKDLLDQNTIKIFKNLIESRLNNY